MDECTRLCRLGTGDSWRDHPGSHPKPLLQGYASVAQAGSLGCTDTQSRSGRAGKCGWGLGIPELERARQALQGYLPTQVLHIGHRSVVLSAEGPKSCPVILKVIRDAHPEPIRKAISEHGRLMAVKSPYLVECLELVEGHGILVLERVESLILGSPACRLRAAADVCRGLADLHGLSDPLFHLDIKPANLGHRLSGENPQHVLLDLGGAKRRSVLLAAGELEPLETGKQLPHRPPEVNDRVPSLVGPASDLYSVGYLLKPVVRAWNHPVLVELVESLSYYDSRQRPTSASLVADLLDGLIAESAGSLPTHSPCSLERNR